MFKKFIFLLLTTVTIVLSLVAPPLTIVIGNDSNPNIGGIPVPIFELVLGLFFIYSIRKLFKGFRFGFSKFDIKTGWIFFPVILTVVINVVTSNSLNALFHQLPVGQILVALLFSFIGALIVGFFEETLARGALFNFFMSVFKNSKFNLLLSSIISSVLFGVIHLGNLLGGATIGYTIYQVVYATAMGFVFSMAYVKYQSLFIPIVMHSIIDFSDFLFNFTGEPSMVGIQWAPIILTLVYIICGLILYKSTNESLNLLGFKE